MRELSNADKCRKNNWKVGDVLLAKSCFGKRQDHYYVITAIGETKVLGRQTMLGPQTTSGEEILPLDDNEYTWRLTNIVIKNKKIYHVERKSKMIYACIIKLSSETDISFSISMKSFSSGDITLKAGREKTFYLCSFDDNFYFLPVLTAKVHKFASKKEMSMKMIEIRRYLPYFCKMEHGFFEKVK